MVLRVANTSDQLIPSALQYVLGELKKYWFSIFFQIYLQTELAVTVGISTKTIELYETTKFQFCMWKYFAGAYSGDFQSLDPKIAFERAHIRH